MSATLTAGYRVGPYELFAPVGAGGMGQVWKARDTRLDRVVAIKFSQAQFNDRFEREARAVAALNHPNVAQIYDVGENYIVMEYVDGEPVRAPGSARKMLDIAVQIADGLAAAHSAGFVHRDLKPDNILITREGRVKILDFGIARSILPQPGADEQTRTVSATDPGMVLGTVAYMSPEQVRGDTVDHRSDIFSLGVILYELLSGTRPFQRATTVETMHAILKEDAPEVPESVAPGLRRVVAHAMEKHPERRFQTAQDFAFALRMSSPTTGVAPVTDSKVQRRSWLTAGAAAGALLLAAAAVAGVWWQRGSARDHPVWSGVRLGGPRFALGPRISPDGQLLAFQALIDNQTQLAIMKPDAASWTVLTRGRDEGYIANIGWSPDGAKLYYDRYWDRPRGVYTIAPLGGEPVLLLADAWGAEPLRDGSLLVARRAATGKDQLNLFWPASGKLEPLTAFIDSVSGTSVPARALPGSGSFVFYGTDAMDRGSPALYIMDLPSHKSQRLAPELQLDTVRSGAPGALFAPTPDGKSVLMLATDADVRHLVSVPLAGGKATYTGITFSSSLAPFYLDVGRDGSVYVDQVSRPGVILRFSPSGGVPEQLEHPNMGDPPLAPLSDGRMIFNSLQAGKRRLLIGAPEGEATLFLQTMEETGPLVAQGGDYIAFLIGPQNRQRIAIASLRERRIIRRLEFDAGEISGIAVSPDGGTVYYSSGGSVWAARVDGGAPQRLGAGDSVALDQAGAYLYTKQFDKDPIRLIRIPAKGGQPETVPLPSDIRMGNDRLPPAAVNSKDQIVLETATAQSFFYGAAIVDARSGRVTSVPLKFNGDVWGPGWDHSGRIVAFGAPMFSSLWRYRPSTRAE